MKAPPASARPITADQLREIIAGLRCPVSSNDELSAMAAAFTGMQLFADRDPMAELASEPEVRVTNVVTGKETVTKIPVHFRLAFARGAMKHWRRKDWRDFAPDIAARFRQAIWAIDPGLPLGDRDGPVPVFVAAVIPLIFPDQHPSASAVGQFLARKTRARR